MRYPAISDLEVIFYEDIPYFPRDLGSALIAFNNLAIKANLKVPGYPNCKSFRRDILRWYLLFSPFQIRDLCEKRIFGVYRQAHE